MKKILFAASALLLVASGASAADLPGRAPAIAPAPVFVGMNWSGFYVGLNAGLGLSRSTATDAGNNVGVPWYALGAKFSSNSTGFTGGAQLGYNWQFNNIVAGLEADAGYLSASARGLYRDPFNQNDTFVHSRGGILTTLRGRLGFAADRTLFYVTGGAIGADVGAFVTSFGGRFTNKTGFQTGWTAGAGVEHAYSQNWSVKAEYLYYDLGNKSGIHFVNINPLQRWPIQTTGHLFRLGLNYHFSAPASAVVAKY